MGHERAAHYLRRIDRLSPQLAELALHLYRDDTLVKILLDRARLPEGTERVAISLRDPVEGPFVIVTRGGRFVTCLGAGMRVTGVPVVTRAKLEACSQEVSVVRGLMQEIKRGNRRETERLLRRLTRRGHMLSREELTAAARWLPVFAHQFFRAYVTMISNHEQRHQYLCRFKRLSHKAHDEQLYEYWREAWALGHYAVILASDGCRAVEESVAIDDAPEDVREFLTTALLNGAAQTASVPLVLRGAWAVSSMAKHSLVPLKHRYRDARDALVTATDGLALRAIAERNRGYRAEVEKVLARRYVREEHEHDAVVRSTRERIQARPCVRDAAIVGHALSTPEGLFDHSSSLVNAVAALPTVMSLRADELYLPQAEIDRSQRWNPQWALDLFASRVKAERLGVRRMRPVHVVPGPGRNDACPCQSGLKHKRCCGLPARMQRPVRIFDPTLFDPTLGDGFVRPDPG